MPQTSYSVEATSSNATTKPHSEAPDFASDNTSQSQI